VAVIKKFGKVSGEKRTDTGISYNISCVPGDMNNLIGELNSATKGNSLVILCSSDSDTC
jgi:hypothetical protein